MCSNIIAKAAAVTHLHIQICPYIFQQTSGKLNTAAQLKAGGKPKVWKGTLKGTKYSWLDVMHLWCLDSICKECRSYYHHVLTLHCVALTSGQSSPAVRALVWLADSAFIFQPLDTELVVQNPPQQDSVAFLLTPLCFTAALRLQPSEVAKTRVQL